MSIRSRRDQQARDFAASMISDPRDPQALSLTQMSGPGTAQSYWQQGAGQFTPGSAPAYGTMGQQQSMASDIYGFLDPAGVNQAQRQAAFGQLAQGALASEAQRRGAQQAAGYGGAGSGTDLALANMAQVQQGIGRAGIEADVWGQAAQRQQEAKNLAAQMAQQRQAGIAGHQLGGFGIEQQTGLGAAQLGQQQYGQMAAHDLARAGFLSDEAYRRQMAEHEANVLMPYQNRIAAEMARAQLAGGYRSGQMQRAGSILGGITGAAGAIGGGVLANENIVG